VIGVSTSLNIWRGASDQFSSYTLEIIDRNSQVGEDILPKIMPAKSSQDGDWAYGRAGMSLRNNEKEDLMIAI